MNEDPDPGFWQKAEQAPDLGISRTKKEGLPRYSPSRKTQALFSYLKKTIVEKFTWLTRSLFSLTCSCSRMDLFMWLRLHSSLSFGSLPPKHAELFLCF
jgi:hypothetical protein